MTEPKRDRRSEWLLARGTSGDEEGWLQFLRPVRDRVLENADLSAGDVLLDVGAGDGMISFGALGLLAFAEEAGFEEVCLEYRAEVRRGNRPDAITDPREVFARAARNPLVPSLQEVADEALAPEEAGRFMAHLRMEIQNGERRRREAAAYPRAVK